MTGTGAGFHGFDVGRPRPAIERHFTHVFARPVDAQRELLALPIAQESAQAPLLHDVERVAGLTLLDQQRTTPVAPLHPHAGQRQDVG
jgi:hypothetical protein